MSQSPEEIRSKIDSTRARLGTDVDAVADKVNPSSIVHRQTSKMRGSVERAKDKVMGSRDDAQDSAQHAAHQAGDAVRDLPNTVTSRTQGNPLAAGLIAFAAGWLISSLVPPTDAEKQAASAVKDKAQPLIHQAGDVVKGIADDMKEPAQNAVQEVKATAQDSAENVKSDATSAAGDVQDRAQEAKGNIASS
ncbi:DUF3618 domain-containing protein [Paenarthrobacter sp. Z7-10]|uniref:DUF3618 domain-containing protein n=1 Tax=Paenarthrobacter sp. Z7-10 TaxID=2787635 RepID=UPI0022A9BFEE|nr:DUF3618 domain-containing protein [Paenarthrobacter sp. Z7-10]MCZ2404358.1 DUF3618 domain-containing protein [Paenarthrobacter sp. Z7-10]